MSDVTDLLERAVPPAVEQLDYDRLATQGRRRRRRQTTTMAAAAAAVVALATAGVVSMWQRTPSDVVGQVEVAPPAGQAVTATGGTTPVLPADSTPVDLNARVLPGVGPDVRLAAVANDGRVVVSATGSDLTVTHPDADEATTLLVPDSVGRCWSMAFDDAGDLWALCDEDNGDSNVSALLLRYAPDATTPTIDTVTGLLQSAFPTVQYARLWVHDGQVAAVVPTNDPTPPPSGQEPAWGDASIVVLANNGAVLQPGTSPVEELPSLRVGGDDTTGSVGAGPGDRTIDERTPEGRTIEIAWLTHNASAIIETKKSDWDLISTDGGRDAFVGSTYALTYQLFTADAALAFGIVADAEGTTTVMQLPTTADGMETLPDRPSPTPTTTLRVAPDGSVHLLAADGPALTAAELPAGTRR